MLKSIALGLAVAATTVGAATAQQAACSALVQTQACVCAAPIVPGQAVGQLRGVQGSVVLSGHANFSPITAPTGLSVGDGVLLGPDGSALVTLGPTCSNRVLPANSTVSLTQVGGCGCLTVQSNPAPVPGPHSGTVGVAAIGALGVGAAVLATNQSSPPAPVSSP